MFFGEILNHSVIGEVQKHFLTCARNVKPSYYNRSQTQLYEVGHAACHPKYKGEVATKSYESRYGTVNSLENKCHHSI